MPSIAHNDIPLRCTICTRKPNFSDVSHLLTHIASKQHLSNYFKIKVKAGADPEARACLDEFDAWYEVWRLDQHLSERMQLKERKKGGGGSRRTAPCETPDLMFPPLASADLW